jgi:type IV pilus assembly protein PilQ
LTNKIFCWALFAATATVAGLSSNILYGAELCEPSCTLTIDNSHPHEMLQQYLKDSNIEIVLEGELREPINLQVDEVTVDRMIRKAADSGGYSVKQDGSKYIFYGNNVDDVTIVRTMLHGSAVEAAKHVAQIESVNIFVLEEANALVLQGTSDQVRLASEMLQVIDYERPNVFMELLVVEYFHGDSFSWGYDILGGKKGDISDLQIIPGEGVVSGTYEMIADLPTVFKFNLSALVGNNEARVVTNPHVAVRSGQPGELNFEEELNIILTNETQNFGATRTLQTLKAGVALNVTPRVLETDYVDLDVKGSVGVFVSAPEGQYAIDRQTVTTKVLVKTGETLVIGGLVKKQVSTAESGVPGLRKIPFFGLLFKSQKRSEEYIETVIYITPHINQPDVFLPENFNKDALELFPRKPSN